MQAQTITTASGERLVVLAEADYRALVAAAEDAADVASYESFRRKLVSEEEELVPSDMVDRILAGENRIKVWREHRGLAVSTLAEKAGIAESALARIEADERDGTVDTLRKLAAALAVTVDDLVSP